MKKEKHDEKWLLSKGWEKIKGFKVDHTMISDDYEMSYWEQSAFEDLAKKCTFYQNLDINDEFASEDLDECIEMQEERDEE